MGNIITSQRLFPNDLNAIINTLQGIGVISGWTCTDGGGWNVAVAAGSGYIGTTAVSTVASTDVTLSAADATYPRRDIIIWDQSTGALAVVEGTPAAVAPVGETNPLKMTSPVLPNMADTDDIMIAEVYVPAAAGSVAACAINDKRMIALATPDQLLTTAGDIMQRGASVAARLAIGTAYQILQVNAGATAIAYVSNKKSIQVSPVPMAATVFNGVYPGSRLVNGSSSEAYFSFPIPSDFHALSKAVVVVIPEAGGTGNLYRGVSTKWGATGEANDANTDTIEMTTVAVVASQTLDDDVSAALTGIAAGDRVGMAWVRRADLASDTSEAACWVIHLLIEYT